MKNRILTLQVEILDKTQALWIWDNHMKNDPFHGVHITAIHEGSIDKQNEMEEEENDL